MYSKEPGSIANDKNAPEHIQHGVRNKIRARENEERHEIVNRVSSAIEQHQLTKVP